MKKQVSEVVLSGKRYISAKRAAEISGYANDYIGQLCRSGKLESTRIGRNWYVGELSILGHKHRAQQELNKKGVLNDKSPHKLEGVHIHSIISSNSAKSLRNSLAVYSNDEGLLLPNLYRDESDISTIIPIKIRKNINIKEEIKKTNIYKKESNKKSKTIQYQPKFDELFGRVLISTMILSIIFVGIFTLKNDKVIATLEGTYSGIFDKFYNVSVANVLIGDVVQPYSLVAKMINNTVNNVIYSFFDKDSFETR